MNTISWQDKKKENKVTDAQLTSRVKVRIDQWQKKTEQLAELQLAAQGATDAMNELTEGTTPWRTKKKELKEIQNAIDLRQPKVDELNEQLCLDMDRLVKDADHIKKSQEKVAGFNAKKSGTTAATTLAEETTIPPETEPPVNNEPAVSIPVMITAEMRQQLYGLQYTEEDVDKLKPEEAHEIITGQITKTEVVPAEAAPAAEEPPPASAQEVTTTSTTAAPPAPAKPSRVVIKKTETEESGKKKGWASVVFGALFGLAAGALIGVAIKGRK